jgi:hypothetical protein
MFAACIEINPVKQSVTGKLIVPKRVWNGFKYRFWYKTPRAGRSEPLKKITDVVVFDPRIPCLSLTAVSLPGDACAGAAHSGRSTYPRCAWVDLERGARSRLYHVAHEGVGLSLTAVGCANASAGAAHKRRGAVAALSRKQVSAPSFRTQGRTTWIKINPSGAKRARIS